MNAYDVPPLMQMLPFTEFLGSRIEKYVGMEDNEICGVDRSLNFKVDVDVSNHLDFVLKWRSDGRLGGLS